MELCSTDTVQKRIEPFLQFSLSSGRYAVKIATEPEERASAFALRHRAFFPNEASGALETDEYDTRCDHLILIDHAAPLSEKRVVGTYRINCSLFSDTFYSQTEFELDGLLSQPGVKMELGRGCIDEEHRKGMALHLLWRGIAHYFHVVGAEVLFGCSSVHAMDAWTAGALVTHFRASGVWENPYAIAPRGSFALPLELHHPVEEFPTVPQLLATYLKLGAKIHGLPALDKEFQCIDFMTILRKDDLHPAFARKYLQRKS